MSILIAPSAGAVLREFAAGSMAGKDGKQHRAPLQTVRLPAERKSVKRGATYKSRTKLRVRLAFRRQATENK